MLTELHHQGHTLLVSSGSIPASALRKVRLTGIERLFRLVLGSEEDVPGLAKGPGHFAIIAETLGVTAATLQSSSIFIGDGIYDMQVAQEAGIVGVGRLTDDNGDVLRAAGAGHLIHDLRDLPALLTLL